MAYEYDGRNYRIAKTLDEVVVTDYYYNNSWQVLEERVAGTPSVQNVWDQRYVDAPIVHFRDANADFGQVGSDGLEEPLYYTNDANMNVTALVTAAGAVAERYAYDPYGTAAVLDGTTGGQTDWATDADAVSDVANELLYCGYRYNPETGNYHVRNREYHSSLGRWLQRDPAGYVDGMNIYQYSVSSPTTSIDSYGTWHIKMGSDEQWGVAEDGSYGGWARCDRGDTVESLAQLITGNPKDAKYLRWNDQENKVYVGDLLDEIHKRFVAEVQTGVGLVSIQFSQERRTGIPKTTSEPSSSPSSQPTSMPARRADYSEEQVMSFFKPNVGATGDCSDAGMLIYMRAVAVVFSGRYNKVFSGNNLPYYRVDEGNPNIAMAQKSDLLYFKNHDTFGKILKHNEDATWGNGYAIMIDQNALYMNGVGKASYDTVISRMVDAYNRQQPPVEIKWSGRGQPPIPGLTQIWRFNAAQAAMRVIGYTDKQIFQN